LLSLSVAVLKLFRSRSNGMAIDTALAARMLDRVIDCEGLE